VHAFAKSLGATPAHALLALDPAGGAGASFVATKAWAIDAFLALHVATSVASGAPVLVAERYAEHEIRPMFLDEKIPTRPMLGLMGEPLYAVCMAPVYPETHPRYAPHPIVVVTWVRDIAEVHALPKVLAAIRERMRAGHGSLYEADELMLPWPMLPWP
jgi:hypothetical protein